MEHPPEVAEAKIGGTGERGAVGVGPWVL